MRSAPPGSEAAPPQRPLLQMLSIRWHHRTLAVSCFSNPPRVLQDAGPLTGGLSLKLSLPAPVLTDAGDQQITAPSLPWSVSSPLHFTLTFPVTRGLEDAGEKSFPAPVNPPCCPRSHPHPPARLSHTGSALSPAPVCSCLHGLAILRHHLQRLTCAF